MVFIVQDVFYDSKVMAIFAQKYVQSMPTKTLHIHTFIIESTVLTSLNAFY